MKKLKIAITMIVLVISSSIFASNITPSIIINGVLPGKDSTFLIKYGVATSELDLESGFFNIAEDTNFTDKTETGSFNIYAGNFTGENEIHTLKFSTVGFKKITNEEIPNSNNFTFNESVTPLVNKIYVSFTNEDTSQLNMSLTEGSSYLIKNNEISNSLTVNSGSSFTDSDDPGYTFKFSWESESDTGVKVPAGDYVAQVTMEYINQN